jgi:uncharacterized protein (DUF1778 family)
MTSVQGSDECLTVPRTMRQAEETILDQCIFFLDAKAHEKFLALLDSPTKPSKHLKSLMSQPPAWEK